MTSYAKKLLYVFESGPYSTSAGVEALDAALIGGSFGQDISLLFLYDGVFQLKSEQTADNVGDTSVKQYTKTFGALEDFDINKVYVHDLSLVARGLEYGDLIIDVEALSASEIGAVIATHDKVFTF